MKPTTPRLYELSRKERFAFAMRYVQREDVLLSVRTTTHDASQYFITYLKYSECTEPQRITDTINIISEREYNNLPQHLSGGKLGRVRGINVFYSMDILDRTCVY